MLIGLGVFGLFRSRYIHSHTHKHDGEVHRHVHMHLKSDESDHMHKHIFGMGMLQGLASNDEVLLLFTVFLGIATIGEIMTGMMLFAIGIFIGMMFFGMLFNVLSTWSRALNVLVSLTSIIYGFMMLL